MRLISCVTAVIVLWGVSSLSGATLAKPIIPLMASKIEKPKKSRPKLDKNQYWLFNPVPPDQMRRFSTDRP